ncbi:MAG: proton-conducting transporter membrane subunit [bacterium]
MNLLPLFVVVPLGTAFITLIISKLWKRSADWIANIATIFLMAYAIYFIRFAGETITYYAGGWEPVDGIPFGIAMVADSLTIIMLLIVNVVGFGVNIYSINYMSHYTDKPKYYTLFLLMMAGLNGVVISGDLFNLFVFLEITAIASYALVAFGIGSEELEASFKYQILGGTASALILLGIALFYFMTGTLNFADASQIISKIGTNPALVFISILFLVGFGLKAALMPFHAWLPDAHPSAPAPISAMLSGVVIKVLGVYTLIRIFTNVFGFINVPFIPVMFLILGTLSMVVSAYLALGQDDYKRLLAYSSVSQIGYVMFAIGLNTPLAFLGGIFHLLNHAASKSLLFLNSGAVVYATDNRDMNKMGGLSKKMPITAYSSLIGSLSISGIPPFGGFWSKLIIILAAVQAKHYILSGVAVLISIVTLVYYLKSQRLAFWGTLNSIYENVKEVPFGMSLVCIILALLSIGMGLLLLPSLRPLLLDPTVEVLKNGLEYGKIVLGG